MNGSTAKISACLVIANEERLLGRCLASIKNIVDEIIVVHDGDPQDRSLQIAENYTTKIFVRDRIGEAEYHRPFSFQQSQHEWILQIDADEFLDINAKEKVKKLLMDDKVDAYSFWWPYWDGNKYISKGPFSMTFKPCLFRKRIMYMIGISHEFPRTYGRIKTVPEIHLHHQPLYNNFTNESFNKKWKFWADLQAKQIIETDKAPCFNIKDPRKNNTLQYYRFVLNHPLMNGFIVIIRFLSLYLIRGIVFSGRKSLNIAIFELRYLWLVRKNIIKYKNNEKIP